MNKNDIVNNINATSENANKLLISPISPLNIQTLRNGYLETCNTLKQNGHLLQTKDHQQQQELQQQSSNMHPGLNYVHTSNLTNGTVVYSPVTVASQMNGNEQQIPAVYDNKLLHQIIAKDVNHPRYIKLTEKNVDSRNTVVKKAPDGAVQITYKNMINTAPMKNSQPVYILPKPENGTHSSIKIAKSQQQQQQQQLNGSMYNSSSIQPQLQNGTTHKPLSKESANIQMNKSLNEINCIQVEPWMNFPKVDDGNQQDNNISKDKTVNHSHIGDGRNLSINLPKISNSSPSCNYNIYSNKPADNSLDNHENTNIDSTTSNHFLHELPKDAALTDIIIHETTQKTTTDSCIKNIATTFTDLNPFNGIDIDLSCLNTDSFDALQLQSFLNNDNQLPEASEMNQHTQTLNTSICTTSDITNPINGFTHYINSSIMNMQQQSCTPIDVHLKPKCSSDVNHFHAISTESHLVQGIFTDPCVQSSPIDSQQQESLPISIHQPVTQITQTYIHPGHSHHVEHELKNIIDVSPEIATTSGGNKIILIGSWNAKNARYQCKFGVYIVDAELIQNGVLRCYSPIHKQGRVKLSVLCDNHVISKEASFTFMNTSDNNTENGIHHDEWLSITDKSLIHLLVERLSFIAEMMGEQSNVVSSTTILNGEENHIEDKLIDICKKLMTVPVNFDFDYNIEKTMTVLHLASALGYIKLIQLLMNWVESNPTKIIIAEANPTCFDQFTLLPIMWSSAKGHFNTTCVLHQWAESTLEQQDGCGCTALKLATECGHGSLVEYLGRLLKKSTISRENSLNDQSMASSQQNSGLVSSSVVNQPKSVDNSDSKCDDSTPRTLGKTLAFIQSMLSDQDDEHSLVHEISSDDEGSLFEAAQFSSANRQRTITEESKALSAHCQLSPGSPSQTALQSPFNRQMRETAEFCEFFYKAKKIEKDFAELTLTDEEQEELYHAANVIQTAYKAYKERRKLRDQEFSSATLIQSYYRRYKQYAAFKKMQKGAVLIQNQYRAHREKAKKKSEAASLIQNYYRRYRQRKHGAGNHESVQENNKLKQQADRRMNRYLKQTTNRFSRELPEEFQVNVETNITTTTTEPS